MGANDQEADGALTKKDFANTWMRMPIYLTILALFLGIFINFSKQFAAFGSFAQMVVYDGYPVDALNFMVSHGYTERVFNNFNWGGFIDWQYPNIPVFIDGRMNGWKMDGGRYIFDDFIEIGRGNASYLTDISPVTRF